MIISQEKMLEQYGAALKNAPVFEKFVTVTARKLETPLKVVTYTKDGKETENTGQPGDYLVTNPGGEQYVVPKERFLGRYAKLETFDDTVNQLWKANGEIKAIVYQGEDFKFIAPWGEEMICKNNDILATTDGTEVYRIGTPEFLQTYRIKF